MSPTTPSIAEQAQEQGEEEVEEEKEMAAAAAVVDDAVAVAFAVAAAAAVVAGVGRKGGVPAVKHLKECVESLERVHVSIK